MNTPTLEQVRNNMLFTPISATFQADGITAVMVPNDDMDRLQFLIDAPEFRAHSLLKQEFNSGEIGALFDGLMGVHGEKAQRDAREAAAVITYRAVKSNIEGTDQ